MVTKRDMDNAINRLSTKLTETFKNMLTDATNKIKDTIIGNLIQSNEDLQLRVSALENKVNTLKNTNMVFKKSTEAAFQHGRLEQILISGIPATVNQDALEETALKILNKIKDQEVSSSGVAACHRIGRKNDTILRFVNRKDADDCLLNRSKLRNIDREAVGLEPDINIYVNENLSPYMRKLAYYCRVLKRKSLIDKVTTFKGIIKITRTIGDDENSRTLTNVIGHKDDIEKLFPTLDDLLEV